MLFLDQYYGQFVKWLRIIGGGLGSLFLVLIVLNYQKLPTAIPTHINILGQIDDYGSKQTIFVWPIVCLMVSLLPTWVQVDRFLPSMTFGNRLLKIFLAILVLFNFMTILRLMFLLFIL